MPFITESIYQKIKHLTNNKHESIMLTNFPLKNENLFSTTDELLEMNFLKGKITSIRAIRSQLRIKFSETIHGHQNPHFPEQS